MYSVLIKLLPDLGLRGRLAVCLMKDGTMLDSEHILKHPFLLKIRCGLALRRMLRRQRRMLSIPGHLEAILKRRA